MDTRRFDRRSRRVAAGTTRRGTLVTLGALALAGLGIVGLGEDTEAGKKRRRCIERCVDRGGKQQLSQRRKRCRRKCQNR
jgi:hypothetical protein